ncbi:hypothetical protein LSH36_547g04017 [Paralvinella palmiformis]|uniref:Uncharacterized protein n=1 Tax=Paralvinella palmiformis TaxID=53620 RepID=A0AAD9MXP2_9ANNE|nr:hypothetical protein LSH36_547g04017 [Paralvinella palmiformis]
MERLKSLRCQMNFEDILTSTYVVYSNLETTCKSGYSLFPVTEITKITCTYPTIAVLDKIFSKHEFQDYSTQEKRTVEV